MPVLPPADVGLARRTPPLMSHEIANSGEHLSTAESSISNFVPFVVEPLLSSTSAHQLVGDESLVDEYKDGAEVEGAPIPTATTSVVPSASTYADATNVSSFGSCSTIKLTLTAACAEASRDGV